MSIQSQITHTLTANLRLRNFKRSSLMFTSAVAALVASAPAYAQLASDALPTQGVVTRGDATIATPSSGAMTVTQSSDRALIDWGSFDIGSAASVRFNQPSGNSVVVNRVAGGAAPSQIAGRLEANGHVAILNANGVTFTGTATVDVGGLVASTGTLRDAAAFMSGGLLDIVGATHGEIVVSAGANIQTSGLAAFVGPTVRNSGTILARAGRVQLGGGEAFFIDLAGDGLLSIGVGSTSPLVRNDGTLTANNGYVQLTARQASAVVSQSIRTDVLPVNNVFVDGSSIILSGTPNVAAPDLEIVKNIDAVGDLTVNGVRLIGNGKINVAGSLILNVNTDGLVTDTTNGWGTSWITEALNLVGTVSGGTTINLGAGLYRPGVSISKNNIAIDGHKVAQIGYDKDIVDSIIISADNISIRNLEIYGQADVAYYEYDWGNVHSRGVSIRNGADNATVTGNIIGSSRTGVLIDGRNVNANISDNLIYNTKSAISVQYTNGGDASNSGLIGSSIRIFDNYDGGYANEWGINLHLNGIWNGSGNPTSGNGALGAASSSEQARILALSQANDGMSVQNQAHTMSNRTHVNVRVGGVDGRQGSLLTPIGSIQAGMNAVVSGGFVNVGAGTFIQTGALELNKAVSLIGAGIGSTIIDSKALNTYGIRVRTDDVLLSGFTLLGPTGPANSAYGIKVEHDSVNNLNDNFTIRNVAITGSRRTGLDLNLAAGALIDGVIVSGVTAGNGIAISDSVNITIRNSTTSGNAWGGVALYQANRAGDQQLTGITIEDSNNFNEAAGLYLQSYSEKHQPGVLNILGYDYTVRNAEHRTGGDQYTFFHRSEQAALDFAVNLAISQHSVIQGWAGQNNIGTYLVGMGNLSGGGQQASSIQAAFNASGSGDRIIIRSGDYAESVTLAGPRVLNLGAVSVAGFAAAGAGTQFEGLLTSSGNIAFADAIGLSGQSQFIAADLLSIAGISGAFGVTGSAENIAIGSAALGSMALVGETITLGNVSTLLDQSYVGATTLNGAYSASAFGVTGAATLGSDAVIQAVNVTLGSVSGDAALTIGGASVILGALDLTRSLNVEAAETVLNGPAYRAASITFSGPNGTVRVTQDLTTFEAVASNGAITIENHLLGTVSGIQNVEFSLGGGQPSSNGDLSLGNVGTDNVRLGGLRITGGNFAAATVKLGGDFISQLSGNQIFSANTLDTLGNVAANVAGIDSGPVRAGGGVSIASGGSGTGYIIAGGPVALNYSGNVTRDVSSGSGITLSAGGTIGGTISGTQVSVAGGTGAITAAISGTGPVSVSSTSGAITGPISAAGPVSLASTSGTISGSVTAQGPVSLTSTTGAITGAIQSTGAVSLASTSGAISSTISAGGATTLSSTTGAVNASVTGAGAINITTGGAISGTYNTPTAISLTAGQAVNVTVTGASVALSAPSGTVGGVFGKIETSGGGTVLVNDAPVIAGSKADARQTVIDSFLTPNGITIGAQGALRAPAGYAVGAIAPGGVQRPPVLVNSVSELGDLLGKGYTAIVIQIDENDERVEELNAAE